MGTTRPRLESTEGELVERARQGDKDAFYSLVSPCERAVYTAAVSILNNSADAEEVAQKLCSRRLPTYWVFEGKPSSVPG